MEITIFLTGAKCEAFDAPSWLSSPFNQAISHGRSFSVTRKLNSQGQLVNGTDFRVTGEIHLVKDYLVTVNKNQRAKLTRSMKENGYGPDQVGVRLTYSGFHEDFHFSGVGMVFTNHLRRWGIVDDCFFESYESDIPGLRWTETYSGFLQRIMNTKEITQKERKGVQELIGLLLPDIPKCSRNKPVSSSVKLPIKTDYTGYTALAAGVRLGLLEVQISALPKAKLSR